MPVPFEQFLPAVKKIQLFFTYYIKTENKSKQCGHYQLHSTTLFAQTNSFWGLVLRYYTSLWHRHTFLPFILYGNIFKNLLQVSRSSVFHLFNHFYLYYTTWIETKIVQLYSFFFFIDFTIYSCLLNSWKKKKNKEKYKTIN